MSDVSEASHITTSIASSIFSTTDKNVNIDKYRISISYVRGRVLMGLTKLNTSL